MRMFDPAHPGEIIRDCMEAEQTVTACALELGVSRTTLSRLLNGRAKVSRTMADALERIGWSNADHWLRMQESYDLAHPGHRYDVTYSGRIAAMTATRAAAE
jgi:addiction module HigA family antidote